MLMNPLRSYQNKRKSLVKQHTNTLKSESDKSEMFTRKASGEERGNNTQILGRLYPSRGSQVKMACIKDTVRAGGGSTGMGVDELETWRSAGPHRQGKMVTRTGLIRLSVSKYFTTPPLPHACSIAARVVCFFFPPISLNLPAVPYRTPKPSWQSFICKVPPAISVVTTLHTVQAVFNTSYTPKSAF